MVTPGFLVDSNNLCYDLFFPHGPNPTRPLYLVGTIKMFFFSFVAGLREVSIHTGIIQMP